MTSDKGAKTRQHILDTAERIFAEQGFDAARVDRIAQEAGVNKALIYYYFASKRALLDELIDDFITTANGFLLEMAQEGYAFGSDEMKSQMDKYNDYFARKHRTVRLLLTESLKETDAIPPLFRLVDPGLDKNDEEAMIRDLNESGFGLDEDRQQRMVTEFFTGIMPMVVYCLFNERWCEHFGLSPDQLERLFETAVDDTHAQNHSDSV